MVKERGNGRFYFDNLKPDSFNGLEKTNFYVAIYRVPIEVFLLISKLSDLRLLLFIVLEVDYDTKIEISPTWRKRAAASLRTDLPRIARSLKKLRQLSFIDIKGDVCKLNPYVFNRGRPDNRNQVLSLLEQFQSTD